MRKLIYLAVTTLCLTFMSMNAQASCAGPIFVTNYNNSPQRLTLLNERFPQWYVQRPQSEIPGTFRGRREFGGNVQTKPAAGVDTGYTYQDTRQNTCEVSIIRNIWTCKTEVTTRCPDSDEFDATVKYLNDVAFEVTFNSNVISRGK